MKKKKLKDLENNLRKNLLSLKDVLKVYMKKIMNLIKGLRK